MVSKQIGTAPKGIDLQKVAAKVVYVGSAEHKNVQTSAGQPRPRADASICSQTTIEEFKAATGWLKAALKSGKFGKMWEGQFPRYVWHREGKQVYEARLVNRAKGEYKGYPLEPDETPRGV